MGIASRGMNPPIKPVMKPTPVPAAVLVREWWDKVVAEAPPAHHRSFIEYAAERLPELEAKLLDR